MLKKKKRAEYAKYLRNERVISSSARRRMVWYCGSHCFYRGGASPSGCAALGFSPAGINPGAGTGLHPPQAAQAAQAAQAVQAA